MRCVITSDLHLGASGAGRQVEGRNGRERDVETAWGHVVDRIIQYRPHAVLVGGDVYDNTRPSIHAMRAFHVGVRRIVAETDAHVVVILGNHESMRTTAALTPVALVVGEPRVHVVTEPQRLRIRLASGETLAVACFPFNALAPDAVHAIAPDPIADVNAALIHAAVRSSANPSALPSFYAAQGVIDLRDYADAFDLIAVGDYHTHADLLPGRCAVYPGSIERTSSNIWAEPEDKGFVTYDTAEGVMRFVPIPTRPMYDYVEFDYLISAEGINAAMRAIAADPKHTDALVRLKVDGIPISERAGIDWKLRNQLRSSCFHFHPDFRFVQPEVIDLGDARERLALGRSLEQDARNFFAAERPAVRSIALRALGLEAHA